MTNFNNDIKNKIFFLLDLPFDDSIVVTKIEEKDGVKTIYLEKKTVPVFCPDCDIRMHSKGIYTRTIKHPVLQDSTLIVLKILQRRWKCPVCGTTVNDEFTFVNPGKQSTNITDLMVLNDMKDLNRTTRSIGEQFFLSDTQVHDLFTSYVDLPRLPLPEYISIDEVYLKPNLNDKYAFVIMDFVSGEPVDIVHNRLTNTLEAYFSSIPIDERKNVKGIISDAYKPYLNTVPDYFPNSVSILDSFHTSKYIINLLNVFVNKLMKQYKAKDKKRWEEKAKKLNREIIKGKYSREVILLQNYRWVLLKNYDDISHSTYTYYHKLLGMNVNTYQIEKMFFDIDPRLKRYHELKEKYIQFNNSTYESEEEIKQTLDNLIGIYASSQDEIFIDFGMFLKSHAEEIIRSFTTIQVTRKTKDDNEAYYARLSNGLMESFNRKPKDYKRSTRGSSNFDYTRNRILWATRKNPSIRGIPKYRAEIHSYRLSRSTAKKRSKTYKTKNK